MGNPSVARKIEENVRYEFKCPNCEAELQLYDSENPEEPYRLEVHWIDGGRKVKDL